MREDASDNVSDGKQKKGGQEMGRDNVGALRDYIEGLKLQKTCLPSRQGMPNKTAIALACGFRRQVFETNKEAAELLEQAVLDLGLDSEMPVETGKAEHTQKRLDSSDRRARELEERLALKTTECENLRGRVKDLEEKLRQYSAFEEVMTTTGRRFVP